MVPVGCGDNITIVSDYHIGIEASLEALEPLATERLFDARTRAAVEVIDISATMAASLSESQKGIDGLAGDRPALHAGLGVAREHGTISLNIDDSLVGFSGDKSCHGGLGMSFAKAVDLLRLAMMATTRRGVCLADVESEFGGVRRTAQRMVAALQEAFPAADRYVDDEGRAY